VAQPYLAHSILVGQPLKNYIKKEKKTEKNGSQYFIFSAHNFGSLWGL
jgi:hypothetical protein